LVKLVLVMRQARLHHGGSGRDATDIRTGLAIGCELLGIGEGRGGRLLEPGVWIRVQLLMLRGMRGRLSEVGGRGGGERAAERVLATEGLVIHQTHWEPSARRTGRFRLMRWG